MGGTAPVLLAAVRGGIARAESRGDHWLVERVLDGVRVRCLGGAESQPGRVYAGTHGDGVLRSDDRGRTWAASGLGGAVVTALATTPSDPSTVYAGTRPPLLYVSRDGGRSWRELDGFRRIRSRWFWRSPADPAYTAYVQALAVSPTDPAVVLAGIEAGAVVRSADRGESWSGHRRRASRDCHSLAFHARDGAWAYESGGTGAAVSRDGGKTWTRPKRGLDRRYCWAVAADAADPEIWYVSASPGPFKAHGGKRAEAFIFRSVRGGPWRKLAGGLPQPLSSMPYGLSAPAAGELYAALGNGDVWHSRDTGETWTCLPLTLGPNERAFAVLPATESRPRAS